MVWNPFFLAAGRPAAFMFITEELYAGLKRFPVKQAENRQVPVTRRGRSGHFSFS